MSSVIRKEIYPVEKILFQVFTATEREGRIRLDGDWVRVGSSRIKTFKYKGLKCIYCGIKGSFFRKELHSQPVEQRPNKIVYHLNLYAIGRHGQQILMTKDHIIPLCRGGKTTLDNLQPMCQPCNNGIKGDRIF
jgi:5-methylcytosine-specific restriction endonuclease McrA